MRRPNPFEKVPHGSPVAPSSGADELEDFLNGQIGNDQGLGYDFDEALAAEGEEEASQVDRVAAPNKGSKPGCSRSHRGHALRGIPTLMGSSYRDGLLIPGNSVTVILAPETLVHAFPPGWASYVSPTFITPMRGAIIYWPWEDMKAPQINDVLIERILELHRIHQDGHTIEAACYGGHGRTGTLLAILAALYAGWAAHESVERFRNAYCQRAIETESQELFVEKMIHILREKQAQV